MTDTVRAQVLVAGTGEGPVMRLGAPLSFWGGVDAQTGRIVLAGHPDEGASVAGAVLVLPGVVGSSSSTSVLLELIHAGRAPAALVLPGPDAILTLAVVIAREMCWDAPPVLCLAADALPRGARVRVAEDGTVSVLP
ncbi:MAG: DUF126 domain-containing protein [Rhodobacterales bacterium]|nr:DUF126 domain-containing protein [Rhodobacterales bacterium]